MHLIILLSVFSLLTSVVVAGPVSDNYELQTYGFGAGGVIDASSSSYSMVGILGEQASTQSGLVLTQQAGLPAAPSLSNPGTLYDRLNMIIDNGGNPTDATFAVAITSDNWASTRYIQDDFTVGETLGAEDWQTFTSWGSGSGVTITGLSYNTIYTVKVKARSGDFTETDWSAEGSASTVSPSLTFSVSDSTITFDELSSANSWTDATKTTILTTSTNAYHGYTVYGHETGQLTDTSANTILDYASPNSAPTSWTGLGFGYTTNDSSLTGGTANRFISEGPNYAGFTAAQPGDPVADHTDVITDTPVTNEQFTISYRVTVNDNQPAGSYTTSLVYVVVPEY